MNRSFKNANHFFHRFLAATAIVALLVTIFIQPKIFQTVVKADTGTGSVSLTTLGTAVTENFDTLVNTAGSTTNTTLPTGWYLTETGGGARDNEQYAVDTGSSTTGDTYSYGAAASTDRALGGLRSGTLIPVFGAKFTNNTGSAITSLNVNYTGEQWRLGTAARADQLDFQISTNATDLSTGTYTDVNTLDFVTPNQTTVGAKDGNTAANRTAVTATISSLNIANGATFFIRWNDLDASGADDGLAVDDFSITPNGTGGGGTTLSINDVTLAEGNAGTTNFTFTVSLSAPAPAGGVTFDIATANGTATAGSDYVAQSLTGQTIAAGNSTYNFTVQVNGDTTTEPNETFFVNVTNVTGTGVTVTDGQGLGTITNDDVSITPVDQIQGSGNTSPFAAQSVTTSGIVTGLRSNGFFMQTPDASVDADPNTSEGVFVFTSSAPPAAAAIGNSVQVTGTVQEFIPSTDPNSPPVTEIITPTVSLLTTGNALPAPIVLTAASNTPNGGISQLEKYEGMRVQVNSLTVIAPTQGTVNEANATSTSNGVFFGVVTGVSRPVREAGIETPDPLPAGAPANVPIFDANPERIRVDSNGQTGTTTLEVTTDAVVTNLVGVLDYAFRAYTILPDLAAPPTVSGNISALAVPTPTSAELTVAGFNLERFFDTVDDPGVSDVVLTTTAFNNRLNKASLAIRNILQTPDVVGVEEMENLTTLQALATKINNDAVAASQPNPNYQAYLVEGNDIGGIDVGFLVKSAKVTVVDVTQFGKTATFTNPNNGAQDLLNDRPPLLLRATVPDTNNNTFAFTVIVNHLRSLNGIDDTTVDGTGTAGGRVRAKRRAQAEYLANLVQTRQTADATERMILVGDFNAFQFNDGYVDVMGIIKGTPAPSDQVVLASSDLVNPNLINLPETLPAPLVGTNQSYSYTFDGNAQILDHVLITQNLLTRINRFHYGRLDADFPDSFRTDPNRPERISDHDGAVAYISLSPPTAAAAEISGKVTTANGRGIGKAIISIIGFDGSVRYARTNPFGYYRFTEISVGQTYIFTVASKQYQFTPQVLNIFEATNELNFTAEAP